jgi:uncharacterized membrane-anchored protein
MKARINNMKFLEKFKSRKFLIAMLGVISGIATVLSGNGGNIGLIAGVIVIVVSAITYIITEGKIDKAGVTLAVDSVKQIIELIDAVKKDTIETATVEISDITE